MQIVPSAYQSEETLIWENVLKLSKNSKSLTFELWPILYLFFQRFVGGYTPPMYMGRCGKKRRGFLSPQLPFRAYHISMRERDRLPSTYHLLQAEEAVYEEGKWEFRDSLSPLALFRREEIYLMRGRLKILQPNHCCPSLRSRFHAGRHKTRRQKVVVPPRA